MAYIRNISGTYMNYIGNIYEIGYMGIYSDIRADDSVELSLPRTVRPGTKSIEMRMLITWFFITIERSCLHNYEAGIFVTKNFTNNLF